MEILGTGAIAPLRQHVGQGVAKRRFDYNCIVISLYGLLEQYIEALVLGYADALNGIVPRYEDLPGPIRERHIGLTFTLIQQADQSRYRGVIDAAVLVANLHSCLNNQTPYKLNAAAFCTALSQKSGSSSGVPGVTRPFQMRRLSPHAVVG